MTVPSPGGSLPPLEPLSRNRSRLLARLHLRRTREREGLVLLEGPHAIRTALAAEARVRIVLMGERADASHILELARQVQDAGIELLRVTDAELATAADTVTPQGLLAVAVEPSHTLDELPTDRRLLLLDGVRDPGNAGTLLRAAAAFGVGGVVALDGTTDPWGSKCVRSSAGEAFRLPVVSASWEAAHAWMQVHDLPLLVADAGGRSVEEGPWPSRGALLIGNEAHGPRPEALAAATHTVAIPLARGVESLNAAVAGSVLLWALRPS